MKIYTRIQYSWNQDGELVVDNYDAFEYTGKVELCCGASTSQQQIGAEQATAYQQMTQQAQQVFGSSSQVFQQLQSTFAPTVAAGPSQQGFSAAEDANLKSQAITQSGVAYKNAKSAVGEAIASQGGGNNPALTSGSNTGIDLGIANSAAANTANELSNIEETNYATGRQNYDTAVSGLAASPNVYNPAAEFGNAATNSGNAASNTANQIASQNSSWVQAVTGVLGGVASAATGGLVKGSGSGSGTGVSDSNPSAGPEG